MIVGTTPYSHAITGRKALFVNESYTVRILDMDPAESDATLTELIAFGISDPATVTGIRKQLWSEHLDILPDDPRLDDPVAAIGELWPSVADGQPPGRVRPSLWASPLSQAASTSRSSPPMRRGSPSAFSTKGAKGRWHAFRYRGAPAMCTTASGWTMQTSPSTQK